MYTPERNPPSGHLVVLLLSLLLAAAATAPGVYAAEDEIELRRLNPSAEGGRAVELVYVTNVPIDVFWRFKTDFSANFLLSNRYITSNRVVARQGRIVITETVYSTSPGVTFRWQTTLEPSDFLLNYVLLNPVECGQHFNYGSIQLAPAGHSTRVTQTSYFDFFGATLWDRFPGPGGMEAFLRYTASWEQETVERLLPRYQSHPRH